MDFEKCIFYQVQNVTNPLLKYSRVLFARRTGSVAAVDSLPFLPVGRSRSLARTRAGSFVDVVNGK